MKDLSAVRSSIIAAAEKHFSSVGFEKTTLGDISSENGKCKTSVYYHFKNKHDIFKAVIQKEFDEMKRNLEEVVQSRREADAELMKRYLRRRLESVSLMGAYGRFVASRLAYSDNLVSRAVAAARKPFDEWEHDFFVQSAQHGLPSGIFADTLANILRALEQEYFSSRDKDGVKKTYEGMIELIIR